MLVINPLNWPDFLILDKSLPGYDGIKDFLKYCQYKKPAPRQVKFA